MSIRKPLDVRPSEITAREIYLNRRQLLRLATAAAVGGVASVPWVDAAYAGTTLSGVRPGPFSLKEKPTPRTDATHYNNYYEFGTGKSDPARYAEMLQTRPWTVEIAGECRHPAVYALEDFVKPHALQERLYRHRCVEAWSMVIPWVGFPLADVLKRCAPTSRAKYVEFTALHRPAQMPGQRSGVLSWPYMEALRIDEAMHPLTLLAVGMYGEVLPNQNGAPLRLVVPWKYGFKGIKAIVKIRLVERQPVTTWMRAVPERYGFYSNVNPDVDRVPWSQRYERRIGDFFKRKTLPFNGYGEQVSSLYARMDLEKYY